MKQGSNSEYGMKVQVKTGNRNRKNRRSEASNCANYLCQQSQSQKRK